MRRRCRMSWPLAQMMTSRSDKQRSLAKGVSILGIAGLICKVVGVLYQIPLNNTIGPEGMGVYNLVFPSYNLLLSVSSVGIPVAISRMVAHYTAREEPLAARKVFKTALVILTAAGILGTLLMMLLHRQLGRATATGEASVGFLMIAPSLLFVCVMSAFRGFMQGRRRMWPTANSQLIEQVGKVFVALPFAMEGMRRGGYALGAAGALLGTSLAEAAALIYMVADHYAHREAPACLPLAQAPSGRSLAREIVLISIPITIGASIVPLAGLLDSFMLKRIMQGYMPQTLALVAYGVYSGPVISLINVPTALAMAIATNLVPAISAAHAVDDRERIRRESATGLRLAAVIGFPCSIGMSLLAEPILFLLFGRGGSYTADQLRLGAQLLEISSLTIVFFTLVQASSGILQALHQQRIPMFTLAAGVLCKVVLNYSLVRVPWINIGGAPYASLLCYLVSLAPNLYYVRRYAGLRLDLSQLLLRPLGASGAMAGLLLIARLLLGARLGRSWPAMGLTVLAATAVYGVSAYALGAIQHQDLPGILRRRLKPRA
ncbi:MAG: polysaccharide biosynthesis C-terminal domain-containing protein [Christensenellales bacterium]